MKEARRDGTSFLVRITPRAGRTKFTGLMDGHDTIFKIAVAAPPVEGRANEELISYLAALLDVPRSAVTVASGEHSRNKLVRVRGRALADIENAFHPDNSARLP